MGKKGNKVSNPSGRGNKKPAPPHRATKREAKSKISNRRRASASATSTAATSIANTGITGKIRCNYESEGSSSSINTNVNTPKRRMPLSAGQQALMEKLASFGFSPLRHNIPTLDTFKTTLKRDFPDIKHWKRTERKLAYFLYSRGWLPTGRNHQERAEKVRHLIFDPSPKRTRLMNVASTSLNLDVMSRKPQRGLHQFKDRKSRQLLLNWAPPSDPREKSWKNYITTVDVGVYKELKGLGLPVVIQRTQRSGSGSCFLQAPAIIVCYLVQMATGKYDGQIDIFQFIRHSFNRKMINQYINTNSGCSETVLRAMIPCPRKKQLELLVPEVINTQSCFENIFEYGPGLVSQFKVYDDFRTLGKFSYGDSDVPQDDEPVPTTTHSMVLISMRYDRHTWWYLLQNTWLEKQYVEVSKKYLTKCIGDTPIMWVKTKVTELPSSFRKCQAKYAEACFDGGDDVDPAPTEGPCCE